MFEESDGLKTIYYAGTEDEWNTGKDYDLDLDNLTFIDNDGNEMPISSTGYSNRFEENGRMFYHVRLISPIEPDEIVAVKFVLPLFLGVIVQVVPSAETE